MEYFIHLATLVSIYAILALSLNLVVGYTGILSVTHAAFFGLGAYTAAIMTAKLGVNFFLALLFGIFISATFALLIGSVLSKFRGDYVALGSVGFNIIIYSVFLNWQSLTRGPLGIPGIPRPEVFGFSFGNNLSFLVLAIVGALAIYLAARFIEQSSFGRVLKAIREDEEAIEVFGYRTLHYKLAVFILGAGMAAVAGALFASYITFIDPSTFTINESIFLLAVVILGGLGSNRGALTGAIILVLLPEFLRFIGFPAEAAAQLRQMVYGLMLVILMLYRPQGLVGEYRL